MASAAAAATTTAAPPATRRRRRTLHERQVSSRRAIREARHGRETLRTAPKGAQLPPAETTFDPERLPERLDALVGVDRLRQAAAGLPAYLVGGAVRDLLLGRPRADIDVAVEGDVDELPRRLGGNVRTHARFATATVRVDGLEVDLAAT